MNYNAINHSMNMIFTPSEVAVMTVDIIENPTQQVLKTNIEISKAKKLIRHLNMGGCFDGFTPAFFLNTMSKSYE